jgi:hypothetical protein
MDGPGPWVAQYHSHIDQAPVFMGRRTRSIFRRAFSRKRSVLAAFYDIKRAYDTVWHKMLLHKLNQVGLRGHMYKFFETFLTNRSIQVKIGSVYSSIKQIDMGIPQGSCIAPTAFNVMLYDIDRVQGAGVSYTLYADDLAMRAEAPSDDCVSIRPKNGETNFNSR